MAHKEIVRQESETAQSQYTISAIVPKPLAKRAAEELQGHLDTLKNPKSTQEQVRAALDFVKNNEGDRIGERLSYGQEQANSILDAVMARIPMYGDPRGAAARGADETSARNLMDLAAMLRSYVTIYAAGLSEGVLNQSLETYIPFIGAEMPVSMARQSPTIARQDIYGEYAFFSRIFQLKTGAGQQIRKGLCDQIVEAVLRQNGGWSEWKSAENTIAAICANRNGDLASYGDILGYYKDNKASCYYLYGQFPAIVSYNRGALSGADYESLLRHYPQNVRDFPDDGFSDGWMKLLQMNADGFYGGGLIGAFYSDCAALPKYDSRREAYAWCLLAWGLQEPGILDRPELAQVAGMAAETSRAVAGRPVTAKGIQVMRQLAAWKPGEAVLDTIITQTGITQFQQYPIGVLKHIYEDREKISEKPVFFMVFTTRPGNVDFRNIFTGIDLSKFDVRAIEPGSDENMVSMMKEHAARLGKRFRYLAVNGHGYPGGVLLKAAAGKPEELDLGDVALLKEIKPLLSGRADVVLNACSAGKGDDNLARTVAMTLGARCFGADAENRGASLSFDANLELSVLYWGANTRIYDYRGEMRPLEMKPSAAETPRVGRAGAIFTIPNPQSQSAQCSVYDMGGKLVSKPKLDSRTNVFTWDAGKAAAGEYVARITDGKKAIVVKMHKAE